MNIFGLSAKLFDVIIKIALHISRWSFWRQFINFQVRNLFLFAQSTITIFSFFAKVPVGAWKLHFTWSEKLFTAVCSFWEESLFCLFWTFTTKNWTSLWTSINNVAKAICYLSKKKQTKQVSFCNLGFFIKIAEYELVKINRPTEGFPAGYSNLRSTSTENYFDGEQCFDKRFSSRALPESEREPVGLSGNLFNMVVKTAFYISKRSFWRLFIDLKCRNNWIFATIDQKVFSPFAKNFVRGSKTVFYVFRRKCWSNMTFWWKQSSRFLVV